MSATAREKIAQSITSRYIILGLDGQEYELPPHPTEAADLIDHVLGLYEQPPFHPLTVPILDQYPNLKKLVNVELIKSEGREPPSIRAMRELELADYEPASDNRQFRYYPKGTLMFNLLRLWAEEIALERLGAYPIETPTIYDLGAPDIRSQTESCSGRHLMVRLPTTPDKDFILRFAGELGLFGMLRDSQLTYKHLPIRLYEFAPSFRNESFDLMFGIRRLMGLWVPDVHSFCQDIDQGIKEYRELYAHFTDFANGMGASYAVAIRVVRDFYETHKHDLVEMIQYSASPAFIQILSDMKHNWVLKHEINTIDFQSNVCKTSTVQLNIRDAALYGVTYADQDGSMKDCTIVQCSIGPIEHWIYAVLEDALKREPPVLPLWLAPVQVRVIPVAEEKHLDHCLRVAEELKRNRIRVDVDERNESLDWRIHAADREWIPYIVVCGDKDQVGEPLSVRVRGGNQQMMSVEELVRQINERTASVPYMSLPELRVSRKPVFRGRD